MNMYEGSIFGGEFLDNGFYLTRVKHLDTASNISTGQLKELYKYLKQHGDRDESCTITVNDQIPLLLNVEEVHQLIDELNLIKKNFPSDA